ncbi:hypothetical protein DFJ77DRAFT_256783 [Powellomyces hirtus]|nr:hypothetical protein DFJ77DRAFT_256783 [Powellomyces hirtus]
MGNIPEELSLYTCRALHRLPAAIFSRLSLLRRLFAGMTHTMNAVTAALLALITGATIVSATVYPYLNASYQTPVGVRTLKNVNFPFSFQEYQITSFPNVAGFYPPDYGLGPCRLGGYNISTGLDPTTKLNATIAFISILDAYNAGCPRYTWVAYANGWHRECPEGTDIRKLLETPGDVPCSTPETRPQLALWMQLGPVDNRCCPDIFFARSTPMNGYLNEVGLSFKSNGIPISCSSDWHQHR